MDPINRYLDYGSAVVIVLTFAFFTAALFVKGITHDLFLEAGVFLVSVKLILLSHRSFIQGRRIEGRLDELARRLAVRSMPPGEAREGREAK